MKAYFLFRTRSTSSGSTRNGTASGVDVGGGTRRRRRTVDVHARPRTRRGPE